MRRVRRFPQRLVRWTSLCVCLALILTSLAMVPVPLVGGRSSISSTNGQDDQGSNGKARKVKAEPPRRGAPAATMPNLDDAKRKHDPEPEAPAPIPSTTRSKRNPLESRGGKRVGDPGTTGVRIGASKRQDLNTKDAWYSAKLARKNTLRDSARTSATSAFRSSSSLRQNAGRMPSLPGSKLNHARKPLLTRGLLTRSMSPPPLADDQFIQNFFYWAFLRYPNSTEQAYWNDILRTAYPQGQSAMLIAMRELGMTVFESAEYAARNRSNHDYVYDLYKTFLMRDPDSGGWAYWESSVPVIGRENVRHGFEYSTEFANLVATLTPNGSASSNAASLVTARVDPNNQTGNQMQARDCEWSVGLLNLPGRAGLDLGLGVSYSSLVWTRSGSYLYFDEDNGSPSPGFRLGFATIQGALFNAQVGRKVYALITSSGHRVELRQVGTSNVYEAGDSSYLQLIDNGGSLLVRTTDGTQMTYLWFENEWRATEIKDRNGNYLTVNYSGNANITNITDTLGRVITFNYDANANPVSITQSWNGQTHTWATFGWGTLTMQLGFSGVSVVGTYSGEAIPVLTQVGFDDGSHFNFEYTGSGQVNVIRRYRSDGGHAAYLAYDYATTYDNCPRISQTRLWAENWTGVNGVPSEVITQYSEPGDGSHQMVAPDGTVYKEFYGTGWQKGLTTQGEVWSGGVRQKWTTMAWTQDNTGVSYQTNPRVTETNIYDSSGNRRRTTVGYQTFSLPSGASCSLPNDISDFAADAATVLRRTQTYFETSATYLDRRIIGLPWLQTVSDGVGNFVSKQDFHYDWGGGYMVDQGAPVQYDASNYGSGFLAGRGNLVVIRQFDVNDPNNNSLTHDTRIGYNNSGSVIFKADGSWHNTVIGYADSFSDSLDHNTLAYPTTVTDPDGFSSTLQYNYDFGARTRAQGPPPAGQPQGAIQTITYDSARRTLQVTTTNNGAYTRYVYGANYMQSFSTVNNVADDVYAIQVFDGAGRVIGAANNHPGSSGGYRMVNTIYDLMGRAVKQSNPGEINSSWVPVGDEAAGLLYTQQTYDWKGRPLTTTNTDGTQKYASYGGCGCAGGEVATLTDEVGRQQKVYADVLGRTAKTEVLNWNGTVYSTTSNTYNVRDQVTLARQYQGADTSGVYQDASMTYDGYGRLLTKHVPEQNAGTAITYAYNPDDTVLSVTDARGATATYGYNNRHLATSITYSAPAGITQTPNVSFGYDAAGNRTSMTDGMGNASYSYDQLSRLTAETRYFGAPLYRSYNLSYGYNLANQLASLSMNDWSQQVNYNHDSIGRLNSVTASGFTNTHYEGYWPNWYPVTTPITTFASSISYRAWGAVKQMTYGNTVQLAMSFNGRLQATRYELSNLTDGVSPVTAGATYDYYADGKIRYAGKLDNSIFDRKYTYDHAGRIQDALTGSEARGGSTPDGPYRESFGYDTWNNNVSETKRVWSGSTTTNSYSFSNNRRAVWSYDANGVATSHEDGTLWYQHEYDAAGKRTRFIPLIDWVGGQPSVEMDDTLDGNSLPGKRADIRRTQDWETGQIYTTTTTTYYLHSTALGGQVIATLDAQGNKTAGYVYMQGTRLATETVQTWPSPTHSRISWENTDPVTGSSCEVGLQRFYWGMQELDPLGSDVTSPPSPPDPLSYETPGYLSPERPIHYEIEGGPSQDYLNANADWARQMDDMYDRGLAEYYWSKGNRSAAQQILARNPNVGLNISGPGAAELAGRLEASLGRNGSLTIWGSQAARALGMVYTPQELSESAQQQPSMQRPGYNGKQNGLEWTRDEKGKLDRAVDIALKALTSNPECEFLLRGASDNAYGVLKGMAGRSASFLNRSQTRPIKNGWETIAWTRTTMGIPLMNPQVDLYAGFFDNRQQFGLDFDHARALTILHELGHVTYQYFHSSMAKVVGAQNLSGEQIDKLINQRCFSIPLPKDITE